MGALSIEYPLLCNSRALEALAQRLHPQQRERAEALVSAAIRECFAPLSAPRPLKNCALEEQLPRLLEKFAPIRIALNELLVDALWQQDFTTALEAATSAIARDGRASWDACGIPKQQFLRIAVRARKAIERFLQIRAATGEPVAWWRPETSRLRSMIENATKLEFGLTGVLLMVDGEIVRDRSVGVALAALADAACDHYEHEMSLLCHDLEALQRSSSYELLVASDLAIPISAVPSLESKAYQPIVAKGLPLSEMIIRDRKS